MNLFSTAGFPTMKVLEYFPVGFTQGWMNHRILLFSLTRVIKLRLMEFPTSAALIHALSLKLNNKKVLNHFDS